MLLDEIKQRLLEIEDPKVSNEVYAEVSIQIGILMATHPELGQIPPNVLFRYLGLIPTGLAEYAWIKKGELEEDRE